VALVPFMDVKQIRTQSLSIATKAGIKISETLPLLDDGMSIRPTADAVNRLLALTAVAAASYGFDKANALAWLKQEKLDDLLTRTELKFLAAGEGNPQAFQIQIEGMWALAWALSMVPQLDFWKDCDNRFVMTLPNLKISQRGADWRRKAKMRAADEIVAMCDLAYCLHWAVHQAQLERKAHPGRLKSHVVTERRRALEWLLSKESWDAVSLDT